MNATANFETVVAVIKQAVNDGHILVDRPLREIDWNSDLVLRHILDSYAAMELLMTVEDAFDIAIPMSEVAEIRTLGQLVDTVHDLVGKATA